jgi:hypothetical protein
MHEIDATARRAAPPLAARQRTAHPGTRRPSALVADVVDRLPQLSSSAAYVKQAVRDKRIEHKQYITEHGQDTPEIRDRGWGISGQSDPRRAETG